ncbi:isochorismatase family protein [Pusillimonas noertemannii]|uniref:isochorismatase family protein n=1 Tax=Pusillimonas noertemannii TaxID=305977 RepID=UPI00333F17E7
MQKQDQKNIASGFGGTLKTGTRPALLIIDYQCAFTQPELSPFASPCEDQLESTNKLIDAMRSLGPIVFTSVAYDVNAADVGPWIQKNPNLATLLRGTRHVQLDERLHYDRNEDLLIYKTQASAFFGTPLAAFLARHGVDMLLVAGTTTSGCVRASVVDAVQSGFAPFVVEEAVCDRSAEQHKSNLIDMQSKYAEVVSVTSMLDELNALRKSVTSKESNTCV